MSGFFVAGGTMRPGAQSYIPRRADDELYQRVRSGEYCTVLTTRQMGKSSLMARTAARLRQEGVACAMVDLQGKGEGNPPAMQWYYGVVKQIADGLEIAFDWPAWWKQQEMLLPSQRFTDFFANIALQHRGGAMVVFVDEVDWMIRLPFSDEFFATIRSCFNRRAVDPAFERLTFVLLGSASPAQLIKDTTRTPFNVGHGIELTDFTPEEARPLAQHLGHDGESMLNRILYWTDGHPYLTQMLCADVQQSHPDSSTVEMRVDLAVQEKLLSSGARDEENNLKFVADRLTHGIGAGRRVLGVYRDILRGKRVQDVPSSGVHTYLRLSGVVKPDTKRNLQVRNRIYRSVFDESWVRERIPLDMRRPAIALALVAIAWLLWYIPRLYVSQLQSAGNDPEMAYSAYDVLRTPFLRADANELLAQFFERREERDQAIMVRARAGDAIGVAELAGPDYRQLLHTFRVGTRAGIRNVAFSHDGNVLETAWSFDDLRMFSLPSGRELSRIPFAGILQAVAFSPDGKFVALGATENAFEAGRERDSLSVRETMTGREIWHLAGKVNAVAFSPDGTMVATGAADGARISRTATGRVVSAFARGNPVGAVVFSADGRLLATGSGVFDVATGKEISQLKPAGSPVALSPNARLLAVGTTDDFGITGSVRVFESATGREVSRLAFYGYVKAVAFSPDGKLVAAASNDHTVRVFEAATGREISRLTHGGSVNAVEFSPDGKLVVTGSNDSTARVFESATGREITCIANESPVTAVAFSPDGKLMALGTSDGPARLFEVVTGPAISRPSYEGLVTEVAFSPDGKLAVTGLRDGPARVFDASTGREISRLGDDRETRVAFSPDGKLVAASPWDGPLRIFDARSGHETSRILRQHDVSAVAFSLNGRFVASASPAVGTAAMYEVATGQETAELSHAEADALAFAPDSKLFAVGGNSVEHTTQLFEAAAGRKVVSNLSGGGFVLGAAFSSDGKFLVVETEDWLHLYRRDGDHWRPAGNRHVPVMWSNTVRFLPPEARCPRCVEVVRDSPENPLKLDRVSFDEPVQLTDNDPRSLVEKWGARLGLAFDSRGRLNILDYTSQAR